MKKILILQILLLFGIYSAAQNALSSQKNELLASLPPVGNRINPDYNEIKDLGENCFLVKENGKWGIIDKNKKILVPIEYSSFEPFTDYLFLATKGDKKGLINKYGNIALPVKYDEITPFADHLFMTKASGIVGIIDDMGNPVITGNYNSLQKLPNSNNLEVKVGNKCGIIDLRGNVIIDPVYDEIDCSKANYMIIKKDGKLGFIIDKTVIKPDYDRIVFTQDEHGIIVVNKGDLKGFVNVYKEKLVSPVYENISRFSSRGHAFVEKNGKLMYVDINGKELTLQEATGNMKY